MGLVEAGLDAAGLSPGLLAGSSLVRVCLSFQPKAGCSLLNHLVIILLPRNLLFAKQFDKSLESQKQYKVPFGQVDLLHPSWLEVPLKTQRKMLIRAREECNKKKGALPEGALLHED